MTTAHRQIWAVVMAYPSETELTTVDRVKKWLSAEDDASADAPLLDLIKAVSALIVLELNMDNLFTTTVTETYDGCIGSSIFLRHRPVTNVMSVSTNYGRQSVTPSVGGAYGYVHSDTLVTLVGGRFGKGPGHVSITYEYGWSTTGREQAVLAQACTEEVTYRWKQRDHVGMVSVGGGGMTTAYLQLPLQKFTTEVLQQLWNKVPV